MSAYKEKFKNDNRLKKLAHFLLFPTHDFRPRWWIRKLWNPFAGHIGKGTIIRRKVRLDNLPFNKFFVGDNTLIEDFSVVNNQVGDVVIGNRSLIGISSVIIGPVTIGDDVMLAQNVVLSGLNHNYSRVDIPIKDQNINTSDIVVEDAVWIGANAVVVPGVRIGKHSVIAAASVVTSNVPPFSIVAGNPARVLKRYNFETKEWERLREKTKL